MHASRDRHFLHFYIQDDGHKPEVVINVMSAPTTEFSGTPDPLSQVPTSSDFGEQHEVQTGSTNNLTKETDIDAISVAIPMFCFGWQVFHWCIMPTSSDDSFTHKFQAGATIAQVVITLRRKTISR